MRKELTFKEKEILKMRNGVSGTTYTLEEIGRIFKLDRERVLQIEMLALKKLKSPSRRTF